MREGGASKAETGHGLCNWAPRLFETEKRLHPTRGRSRYLGVGIVKKYKVQDYVYARVKGGARRGRMIHFSAI